MSTVIHEHLNCPVCRYDLFGLTEPRCPECGRPFTLGDLREWASSTWWSRTVAPHIAVFAPPVGTGLLVFFAAVNVLWIIEASRGSHINPLLGSFMALLPWVMLCAMGQSLLGRSSLRRAVAFGYLLSVCAVLLLVDLDSYRDDVNAMGAWFLMALHTDVWVVLGILFAKASIILQKRKAYSPAWPQSYAFILCLIVITLGATFVFQAYACNEASGARSAGLDVITQHGSSALSLVLMDLALGIVFLALAPLTAYLLGVPLTEPIDFSLLPKRRQEKTDRPESTGSGADA